MKKYIFHASGMHCASCKILIEHTLEKEAGIRSVHADLKTERVTIETESDTAGESLAAALSEKTKAHGYVLSVEKAKQEETDDGIIWLALPIGLSFLALFLILQKSGILNLGIGGSVTPVTGFFIGVVASLSSCLAVVGGLVLSLSAKVAQDDRKNKNPFVLFHAGRLAWFALLGGTLGLIGKTLGISYVFSAILGLAASAVMIVLGLNLVGIFKKSKFTLPSGIFSFFKKAEHETFAPILIGVGTFFLPCGFTQSMQIAALSSGSFLSGMLIMLSFALGTLPVLSILSFGSASFARGKHAPLFFKSAGIVVIGLGVFAFLAGLAGIGIIRPLFNI